MDRDAIILDVLNKTVSTPRDPERWDRCWRDMAETLRNQPYHPDLLIPPFLKTHDIVRWDGEWQEVGKDFVPIHDELIRSSMFEAHLKSCKRIVELGSGSGRNIALLAEMFPEIELVASDFSYFSRDIVGHIAQAIGRPLSWFHFDMGNCVPASDLRVDESTAVLTVHAMEQLGSGYLRLFEVLCAAKPSKVVNIEPLNDLYDRTILFDELAYRYHHARDYLDGWASFLREQEQRGRIIILQEPIRSGLGDKYHEASSLVVWRPL